LEIQHENGDIESFGYYPQTGGMGNIDGPGTVKPNVDVTRVADNIGAEFYISDAQFQQLKEFVEISDRGAYSLDGVGINDPIGTWNCASWVRDAVLYMDLNVQVPLLVIAPWFLPTRVNPSQGLLSIWDAEGWACADPYGI